MRVREARKIQQLPGAQRNAAVLDGLVLLSEHVLALTTDAEILHDSGRRRGAAVLDVLAAEEAAKVFMLLDIVRAGWRDQKVVGRILGRWLYSHLARGLYVQAYSGQPANLRELREYVDLSRRDRYLDGPTGVDRLYRNEIEDVRESTLYVDYVVYEGGAGQWVTPADRAESSLAMTKTHFAPRIVTVLASLARLGVFTTAGLAVVRDVWQQAGDVNDSTRWNDIAKLNLAVVQALIDAGMPRGDGSVEDLRTAVEGWSFPLTGLDLSPLEVPEDEIAAQRDDWLRREWGESNW